MGASPSLLSANAETFKESNGAPSFGCMIGDRGNSEPASSIFSDDAPPSLSDVARRDASESSFDQNLHEVNFEEVTLNFGDNFPDHGTGGEFDAISEDDWEAHNKAYSSRDGYSSFPLSSRLLYSHRHSAIPLTNGVQKRDDDFIVGNESSEANNGVGSANVDTSYSFKNWMKGDILGRGSFHTVYEGITDDGYFFAVTEASLVNQDSHGKQRIAQLQQEISLLSHFNHDNIVPYLGTDTVCISSHKGDGKLYIFVELATKGLLVKLYQRYHLRDCQVSSYTRQILSGLKYLHERTVVHRDIRCANILLDASGSVKLAGFGLAKATALNDIKSCKGTSGGPRKIFKRWHNLTIRNKRRDIFHKINVVPVRNNTVARATVCSILGPPMKGTPYWMAPEVVNNRHARVAADIWSLGCTVLEMLTRKNPYSPLEGMQALFRIGSGEPPSIPETLSAEAKDFIRKCLYVNPKDRPTAAQLLEHPYLKISASLASITDKKE